MSNLTLGKILGDENVFLVFDRDGRKQIALAQNEEDLPTPAADIAFAASLSEIKAWVSEMEQVKALGVSDEAGGVVLQHVGNGGQK